MRRSVVATDGRPREVTCAYARGAVAAAAETEYRVSDVSTSFLTDGRTTSTTVVDLTRPQHCTLTELINDLHHPVCRQAWLLNVCCY